ncbi:MAG: hypothetical protein UFG06_13880 [Lachnospiraceae bacterium]|nr:hypothetical protein [Lachnospiraceae bacterium]
MNQCEGQISLFDIIKPEQKRTLNDYWHSQAIGNPFHFTRDELISEQEKYGKNISWWFLINVPKCCDCYPMLQHTNEWHNEKSYTECLVCGRKTEPINDYSWQCTKNAWIKLMTSKTEIKREDRMREHGAM